MICCLNCVPLPCGLGGVFQIFSKRKQRFGRLVSGFRLLWSFSFSYLTKRDYLFRRPQLSKPPNRSFRGTGKKLIRVKPASNTQVGSLALGTRKPTDQKTSPTAVMLDSNSYDTAGGYPEAGYPTEGGGESYPDLTVSMPSSHSTSIDDIPVIVSYGTYRARPPREPLRTIHRARGSRCGHP